VALTLSLVFFSTTARAAESDPTIVLVHGAFASSAGWDGVAAALHKDGYKTPALGLTSVSDDAAIVRYRFEATQALRHVLARAVVWGMLETNPAK
jgi:pimeloyl-ACP methyl ester carboxylesterase